MHTDDTTAAVAGGSRTANETQATGSTELDSVSRAALIRAAIALFRQYPFHHVTLERVAVDAGLDSAAVQAGYSSMDELLVDVIDVWNAQRMAPIIPIAQQHGAVPFLRAIVIANVADPALMRLLTASVSIAAIDELPMATALRQRWISFHALVQRALIHDIDLGREPNTMEPARGAEQLIAMYEGLQLQSMLRPHMDVREAYERAVTRLRDGWTRSYTPPTWEL